MKIVVVLALALFAMSAALVSCAKPGGAGEGRARAVLEHATVAYVVDGDTLYVDVSGEERKVRLIGIDCPESVAEDESRNTPEGAEASDFTKSILSEGQEVFLERDVSEKDKYGRYLYYVWLEEPGADPGAAEVESKMLNAAIVRAGYAQAKRYPPDMKYAEFLEQAQAEASAEDAGVSCFWK